MFRAVFALLFAAIAFAQSEIAAAAKSPVTLARYVDAHPHGVDWAGLWQALGVRTPDVGYELCAGKTIYDCSAEIVSVLDPDQSIVIIRSSGLRSQDVYVRYLNQPNGGWRFAGVHFATLYDGYPRRNEVMRIWRKPFLKVSSNLSQTGGGFQLDSEEWFDLTEPDFEPVFSFTREASLNNFGFAINHEVEAYAFPGEEGQIETIHVTVTVAFSTSLGDRPHPLGDGMYTGVYRRGPAEKAFTLASACRGFDPGATFPTQDFEALQGLDFTNEQALAFTLPGLRKIAEGSDAEAKRQLRSILQFAKDTPEKRELLQLLGN